MNETMLKFMTDVQSAVDTLPDDQLQVALSELNKIQCEGIYKLGLMYIIGILSSRISHQNAK